MDHAAKVPEEPEVLNAARMVSVAACSLVFIPPLVFPIMRPRPRFFNCRLEAVRCALRYVASIEIVLLSGAYIAAKVKTGMKRFAMIHLRSLFHQKNKL